MPGPRGAVAAAILAASPHNTQPWEFAVTDRSIDVFTDPRRRTGSVDPFGRERYAGMGCALENLVLACPPRGLSPAVTLLPDGPAGERVAHVELTAVAPRTDAAVRGDRPAAHQPRPVRRRRRFPRRARRAGRPGPARRPGRCTGSPSRGPARRSARCSSTRPRRWSPTSSSRSTTSPGSGATTTRASATATASCSTGRASARRARRREAAAAVVAGRRRPVLGRPRPATCTPPPPPRTASSRRPSRTTGASSSTPGGCCSASTCAPTARGIALHPMNQITERIDREGAGGHDVRARPGSPPCCPTGARPLLVFRVGQPVRAAARRRAARAAMVTR